MQKECGFMDRKAVTPQQLGHLIFHVEVKLAIWRQAESLKLIIQS